MIGIGVMFDTAVDRVFHLKGRCGAAVTILYPPRQYLGRSESRSPEAMRKETRGGVSSSYACRCFSATNNGQAVGAKHLVNA